MKNILRGQIYMLPKYIISHFVFIGIATIMVLTAFFTIKASPMLIQNAGIFACVPDILSSLISVSYIFILTAQVCLSDFSDKTSYYELMGGHTRLEVYFGRAIPCIVLGTLGTLVLMIVPDITATFLLGWGGDIPLGQIILRRLLLVFPLMRICCECVFLSFLIRNMVAIMVTGYLVFLFGGYISSLNSSPWLATTSISMLYETDVWTTYGLDSKIHFSFGASLQPETIVSVILVSLAAGAISLIMGYFFFAKDDMN